MPEIEHLVRFKFLFFLLSASTLFCQSHPDVKIDSLLKDGIEKIISQNYESAELVFNNLDTLFPKNPLGNIYLAATAIAKSVDYEEEVNEDFLDSLLSLAEQKSKTLLEKDKDNLWYNYYQALIYGYKAYYLAISGNIISAFSDGVFSLQGFQKCLEIDENFNEAFIALGTYKYWKSAQVKSLSWLPFISDDREEGIKLLEKSIESFSYNRYLADYSLIWIYIDYGESEKAIDLGLEMLKANPESRFFRWGLARAYQDVNKTKAIEVYSEILKSIETLPNRNQFNDIVLKHKIAMLYNEIGEKQKSLELCNEILDFEFKSIKIKERLQNRIERAEKLKKELIENLRNDNKINGID